MDTQSTFLQTLDCASSPRADLIVALSSIRGEWQEAAGGESLINIEGSVGLILADIAVRLGLTSQEQYVVMGADLYAEVALLWDTSSPANQ